MGGCLGGDANSRGVNRELRDAKIQDTITQKLLLLGSGGSGKSTFFKQLALAFGDGFANKDRLAFKAQIYDQVIGEMQILVKKCVEYSEEDPDEWGSLRVSPTLDESVEFIRGLRPGQTQFDKLIAKHIRALWQDEGIQAGFEARARLCVTDSSAWFFGKAFDLAEADYLPSDEDILFARHRTTGMNEKAFVIDGTTLRIVDVGGQRSERRKWIHHFEHVTGVIFVMSLSCFDEVLYEDEGANNMDESISVFTETVNARWFTSTSFIFFMNKSDLFQEKLAEGKSLQIWRPDYDGENTFDDGIAFVKGAFLDTVQDREKKVYSHVTHATNRDNVMKVFRDVQHIVINKSLEKNFMA